MHTVPQWVCNELSGLITEIISSILSTTIGDKIINTIRHRLGNTSNNREITYHLRHFWHLLMVQSAPNQLILDAERIRKPHYQNPSMHLTCSQNLVGYHITIPLRRYRPDNQQQNHILDYGTNSQNHTGSLESNDWVVVLEHLLDKKHS